MSIKKFSDHFLFNSLNTIEAFVQSDDKHSALELLSKFAVLIRSTFRNSRENFILLKDELNLLQLYLDLERHRHSQRFDYKILNKIIDYTQNIKISEFNLFPVVEKLIWESLTVSKNSSEITITISLSEDSNQLTCSIRTIYNSSDILPFRTAFNHNKSQSFMASRPLYKHENHSNNPIDYHDIISNLNEKLGSIIYIPFKFSINK